MVGSRDVAAASKSRTRNLAMAPGLVRQAGPSDDRVRWLGLREKRAYEATAVLVSELAWVAMIVALLHVNAASPCQLT
jgi:hypothetical protein